MASKKEKHARMLEKRAAREAAVAEVGRKALEADRARRKAEEVRMWDDAHKVHLKRNRFHEKCPNCAKVKAQQAIDRLAKAAAKRHEHSERITSMIADGASEAEIATAIEDSQKALDPNVIDHSVEFSHKGDNTPIDLSRVEKISA